MAKCEVCGTELDVGAKFCGECGAPVLQEKECPQCHARLPVKAKFCGACGYNFATGAMSAAGAAMLGSKNTIAGDVVSNVSVSNCGNVVNSVSSSVVNNVVTNVVNNVGTESPAPQASGAKFRVALRVSGPAVRFGRQVFPSAKDLFGTTAEERIRLTDPANCNEYFEGMCADGCDLHVVAETGENCGSTEVVLTAVGCEKIKVIKIIRQVLKCDLKTAKDLVAKTASSSVSLRRFSSEEAAAKVVADFSAIGAKAECRKSDKPADDLYDSFRLKHDAESGEIAYKELFDGDCEGPFSMVKGPCIYVERKAVGEMEWTLELNEEFSLSKLKVVYGRYDGGNIDECICLCRLEYDGKVIEPSRKGEFKDSDGKTNASMEGIGDHMIHSLDLCRDELDRFWLARVRIYADMFQWGCAELEGSVTEEIARYREKEDFQDDWYGDTLAMQGARIEVSDLLTGKTVFSSNIDRDSPGQMEFRFEGTELSYGCKCAAEDGARLLFFCKRFRFDETAVYGEGVAYEDVELIKGAFDSSKIRIEWKSVSGLLDENACAPDERTIDNVRYGEDWTRDYCGLAFYGSFNHGWRPHVLECSRVYVIADGKREAVDL